MIVVRTSNADAPARHVGSGSAASATKLFITAPAVLYPAIVLAGGMQPDAAEVARGELSRCSCSMG